jgi:hypothetical protein
MAKPKARAAFSQLRTASVCSMTSSRSSSLLRSRTRRRPACASDDGLRIARVGAARDGER